jgi:flavin reductase (DIM6/NTAB) family NADH-FMN oxidoreductase RutF
MAVRKIDHPEKLWDRIFAPSSCLAVITTVDSAGRVNAASFGTCVRVCHDPVYVAFTVGHKKNTADNIRETGEFVVNLPKFERDDLERVRVVGLPFDKGVNELERAGLTGIPSRVLRPPRVEEFPRHFECKVEWTQNFADRLMVCGKVVAVSADEGLVEPDGKIVWEKVKPAHFCGRAYDDGFVAAYEKMLVRIPYEGPEALRYLE